MSSLIRIALLCRDSRLETALSTDLGLLGYEVSCLACDSSALGLIYCDPPHIMICEFDESDRQCRELLRQLRSDNFFSTIPVLALVDSTLSAEFDWCAALFDDFLQKPVNPSELGMRLKLSQSRMMRVFDNNPLTRLPGNTSIQTAIEAAMGMPSVVCYTDINHFKPYNDVYGFSHGDEVLRMLGRLISNAVQDSGGGFCGHIGGDDFVFIIPVERTDEVCRMVIDHFDQITCNLFEDDVRRRGYYLGTNRKGEKENIPLLSVSIAVVNMQSPAICHSGKVAEVAAELKHLAKESVGSCYVTDRRDA